VALLGARGSAVEGDPRGDVLLRHDARRVARLAHARLDELAERRREHVADLPPEVLVDALAADGGHRVVDAHVAHVVVDEREADRRRGVDRVHQRAHLVAGGACRALAVDVARAADERARRAAGLVDAAPGALQPVHRPVRPDRADVDRVRDAVLERVVDRVGEALAVVGVRERDEVLEARRRAVGRQPVQPRQRRRPPQLAGGEVDAERARVSSLEREEQLLRGQAAEWLRAERRGHRIALGCLSARRA
jgi:hypothetical protein